MGKPEDKFEIMQDYAHRKQLAPYEDGRKWVYLNKPEIRSLAQIANYFYTNNKEQVEHLAATDTIKIYATLAEVPGNNFIVIYFENVYFLKEYK